MLTFEKRRERSLTGDKVRSTNQGIRIPSDWLKVIDGMLLDGESRHSFIRSAIASYIDDWSEDVFVVLSKPGRGEILLDRSRKSR